MEYCIRCRLRLAMKIVNVGLAFFGIGMIIYSLWLLKRWKEAVAELVSISPFPKPWFVYTCLGLGIIVCLSTLVGHMAANRISVTTLSIYILSACCIILLQLGMILAFFFNMIRKFNSSDEFKRFLSIHLTICRLIGIAVLLVQVHVLMLAIVLLAMGPVSRNHCHGPSTPDMRHSFLLGTESQLNAVTSLPIVTRFRF